MESRRIHRSSRMVSVCIYIRNFFFFEDLVKEFYASMRVKEENGEKFLESTIKGVKFQVTQHSLSSILNIPNQGNQLFHSWFSSIDVTRVQLILEYTKPELEFNSKNLKDSPKILHNMIL